MKKAMFSAIAVVMVGLVACGGQAKAAPLNENFTANPANTVCSIKGATGIEKTATGVNIYRSVPAYNNAGAFAGFVRETKGCADMNGTVWANMQAQAAANGLVRYGSSNKYLSAKNAEYFTCPDGTNSVFMFGYGAETLNDACAMFQTGKGMGN
jgi:hypothetical protein